MQEMVEVAETFLWHYSLKDDASLFERTPLARCTRIQHLDFVALVDADEWVTLVGVDTLLQYVISAADRPEVVFLPNETMRPHLVPSMLEGCTAEEQEDILGEAAHVLEQTERYAMTVVDLAASGTIKGYRDSPEEARHFLLVVIDKVLPEITVINPLDPDGMESVNDTIPASVRGPMALWLSRLAGTEVTCTSRFTCALEDGWASARHLLANAILLLERLRAMQDEDEQQQLFGRLQARALSDSVARMVQVSLLKQLAWDADRKWRATNPFWKREDVYTGAPRNSCRWVGEKRKRRCLQLCVPVPLPLPPPPPL